jgi:5-methyltetrahydropteroyltriglutamate--homocysteine methyltransferase
MADDFKYHIDHAGGLVRPAALLEARRGRLDGAELAQVTDEAIAEVARVQRRIGMSAISDGQYRRATWTSVLYDGVEGFGGADGPVGSPLSDLLGEAGSLPDSPAVVAKLEAAGRLAAAESSYLLGVTQRSAGVALPAAGFVAERSFDPARTPAAYSSPELVGAELAGIVRTEIQALAADGVRHVQVANPGYALTISRAGRDRLTAHGVDPDGLLDRMATADLASIEALDTDEEFRVSLDITTGGAVDLTGGYDEDAVARFFSRLPFYRVQVEHLAGAGFPLTSVPAGRVLALGVVDVRAAAVPPVEELLDRVDAVTAILDVDDIAISTNGSFAPVAAAPGQLSWAEQVNRLQLVEMVARYYWGNEL